MATDEPILIKRYANRKLYDQGRSRYVTLEELEELIRQGREIRVVDAVSGEDLTGQTLAQIILDTARGRRTALPVGVPAPAHPARHGLADFVQESLQVEPRGNRGEPARDGARPAGLGSPGGVVAVGATRARRRRPGAEPADAAGLTGGGRRAEGEAPGSRVAAGELSRRRRAPPPARSRTRSSWADRGDQARA